MRKALNPTICAITAIIALLLLGALPAVAQQHPNVARGLSPASSSNPGDVDDVNRFNGNLVIGIPLGLTYPVNAGLSYQLMLTYNNGVWDHQQVDNGEGTLTQAIPNRTSNAGLGWLVSMGRLNPPGATEVDVLRTTYMSPDGGMHTFYPTLHEGETAVAGVEYTRDGSYLRYQSAANEIELPNGTVHKFNGSGFPIQIRDRYNNQINIDYSVANEWRITDTHGRLQRVIFRTGLPGFTQAVDRIELSAFNGTTATYQFRYSNDDGVNFVITGCRNSDPSTANQAVALLTRLTLPDGSSYSMPVADHSTQTSLPCQAGMIKGMTLPTLGRIEWDYITYSFPTGSSPRTFRQSVTGVGARRLKDAAGGLIGEWSYRTALTTDPNFSQPQQLVNTVITPLGDKTEHFFSVSTTQAATGWSILNYGLPITSYETDGGSPTRNLSQRVYDCDPGTPDPVNCVLKRTGYLAFDRDAGSSSSTLEENTRRNQRVLSTRTNYDDNGLMEAVVYSSFDGLGHYRQTDLSGTFGQGDTRTVFINYNPGQVYPGAFTPPAPWTPWVLETFSERTETEAGATARTEFCFNPGTGFLERKRILKVGTTRRSDDIIVRFVASANGNVSMEDHFGGDGGNLSTDPTISLCTVGLPSSNQYRIVHTYEYGALKSSQSTNSSGGLFSFKAVDYDIDLNTGLVRRSRDVSGSLTTLHEYDAMGRPTFLKPAEDGWTRFTYTRATSPSALAELYVGHLANGGGTVLSENKDRFDALGRLWQEHERMPNGTWSIRETLYNALGWRTSVSEVGAVAKKTQFLNYDPFGRPATVRPPDGGGHDVTFTYSGVRSVARTVKVATSYNTGSGTATETGATATELYDRQGRLVQVTEPNNVITKYEYDIGNRLKRVCQNASGASCGQERLFTYDNRGFLTSEKHPEKGAAGNGTISYFDYTCRGLPRRVVDGPNDLTYSYDRAERLTDVRETGGAQRPLKSFTYGTAAGNGPGDYRNGKMVQAQRYNYPALGGTTHTALVTEAYVYGGREGRVSRRDTSLTFNGTTTEVFNQGFTHNELGQVASMDYPQCAFAACTSTLRTVANTYTQGRLTAVNNYTGTVPGQAAGVGITYHPNGMVNQISHANGVVVTQGNDPNGIARPASFTATKDAATLWTTGTYQYDGAGNIWKAGTSWFEYDALSRLKTGVVFPDPLGGGTQQKQTYGFDNYGNITSITTQIGAGAPAARSTATSTATNRLTGAVSYDAAGNLTSWNGAVYEYDAFNQMKRMVSGAEEWLYMYTAAGERFWAYRNPTVAGETRFDVFTIRDLGGRPLRQFANSNYTWTSWEDYIYRDGSLFAAYFSSGQRRHFHLDHLGSPRLVTNNAGGQTNYHVYYPFGEEATPFTATTDRMKFTGQERDLASLAGANPTADDLDYMHARFHSPLVGRFTSTDPVGGTPHLPQAWNRYTYVMNRPTMYSDPTGMYPFGRTFPPVGMTIHDVITVTAPPWVFGPQRIPITNPGMLSFLNFWNWLGAVGGGGGSPGPQPKGPGTREPDCGSVSFGIALDVSTINPFTSGGGGTYGVNLQYVPGEGLGLYTYASPADQASLGFDLGAALTGNVALGSGGWEGDFTTVAGSFGPGTGGGFYTPPDQFPGIDEPGVGWYGLQGGGTVGAPIGLGVTTTNYKKRAHLGFRNTGCN